MFLRQEGLLAQFPEGSVWYERLLVSACAGSQRVHIGGENVAECKTGSCEILDPFRFAFTVLNSLAGESQGHGH